MNKSHPLQVFLETFFYLRIGTNGIDEYRQGAKMPILETFEVVP